MINKINDKEDRFIELVGELRQLFDKSKAKEARKYLDKLQDLYLRDDSSLPVAAPVDFPLPKTTHNYDFYVFSDGGCRGNPGPGAWGMMIQDPTGAVVRQDSGSSASTTNNKMELAGAIMGLRAARDQSAQSVLLVSDSKYVLEGIRSWLDGWKRRGWKKADKKPPENLEQWQEIDELRGYFRRLDCQWVKGHAGHPQNEHCDKLVNEAIDEMV